MYVCFGEEGVETMFSYRKKTQCADVSSHEELIKTPPQKCIVGLPGYSRIEAWDEINCNSITSLWV